jgi:hypothetical protein
MGKVIDGGLVPEDDPMFNGSWMAFSIRKPMAKQPVVARRIHTPTKAYYILINPDHAPRGPGWLGAVISRHYSMVAALNAQDRFHREALTPVTTAVYSSQVMPGVNDYLGAEYCGPNVSHKPVHVRTILKGQP